VKNIKIKVLFYILSTSEKKGARCGGGGGGAMLLKVVRCGGSCGSRGGNDCASANSVTVGWLVILILR